MKSILIFIPNNFNREKAGYIVGKVTHDTKRDVKKFYIIGTRKMDLAETNKSMDLIGYYYGIENSNKHVANKYADWLNIRISSSTKSRSVHYHYYLESIIVNYRQVSTLLCNTTITIYDQLALQETELFLDNAISGNHFHELMEILQSKVTKSELKEKFKFMYAKEILLTYCMYLILYVTLFSTKVTKKLLPVLKFSSLGLHVNGWLENWKWVSITIIQNRKLTLKTGNYIFASIVDVLLGIFVLQLILRNLQDTSPSHILLNNAEKVVESLKNLIHWLMGAPAGLKLNHPLNNMLGKFFLYHIHLWWTFLIFMKPVMDFAFDILLLFGRLGITFQISIAADLLAIVSFHTYCIYVYAARLFNIQLNTLTALFHLFLGKKKNPLRKRVDSCEYKPDQLFVGTLLFTILLFLMPTTWVYYTVFTTLRLLLIGLGGCLTRLRFYLQVMPIYAFIKWIFHSNSTCNIVNINLHADYIKGPITLIMTLVVSPWSKTWKECIADTIICCPSIEWNDILSNMLWGQLLYPL